MDEKEIDEQELEKEISLDNYPFVNIGFIIGITYGLIIAISYTIFIYILKMNNLEPIFYIAAYIGIIFALLYAIYAIFVMFDMTEKALKKLKNKDKPEA